MWNWLQRVIKFIFGLFQDKPSIPDKPSPIIKTDINHSAITRHPAANQKTPLPLTDPCTEPAASPSSTDIPPEYRKSKSLMTFQERKFYRLVLKGLSSQYSLFSKVRLADVLWLANEPHDSKYHWNQIQCKHFDFILCDKVTFEPLLVLELDDSSHSNSYKHESDELKNRICKQVGLPLLRVKVENTYAVTTIQEEILTKILTQPAHLS